MYGVLTKLMRHSYGYRHQDPSPTHQTMIATIMSSEKRWMRTSQPADLTGITASAGGREQASSLSRPDDISADQNASILIAPRQDESIRNGMSRRRQKGLQCFLRS